MSLVKEPYADERKVCMEKYGNKCISCKMSFPVKYGKITPDLLIPYKVQVTGKEGVTSDLIPVCPNCFAVLSVQHTEMTIEEVQQRLKHRDKVNSNKGKSHKQRFYKVYFAIKNNS